MGVDDIYDDATDDDIDDDAADDDIDDDADDLPGRQPQDWSPPCNTGLPRDARTRQLLSALELERGLGKRWVCRIE